MTAPPYREWPEVLCLCDVLGFVTQISSLIRCSMKIEMITKLILVPPASPLGIWNCYWGNFILSAFFIPIMSPCRCSHVESFPFFPPHYISHLPSLLLTGGSFAFVMWSPPPMKHLVMFIILHPSCTHHYPSFDILILVTLHYTSHLPSLLLTGGSIAFNGTSGGCVGGIGSGLY